MSTRILALLTTTAATLTLAGGITAALAAPPPSPPTSDAVPSPAASPSTAPAASPPASPSATPSPGKDDAALEECRDADCEIEITDGQEIVLDEKYGMKPIKVDVDGTLVTFTIRTANSEAKTTVYANGPNTSANFNGLTLRPHMTKDGKVMLTVSHS
ncbi:hypothetical protein [Actinomadura sp. 3N407]|uniref:hypothetical protein n=1 Tax=Actinomadura sp. 3N407 TaxID=3457423 RepID=UPI003FCDAB27